MVIVAVLAPDAAEQFVWVDPAGVRHTLEQANGYVVLMDRSVGMSGRFGAPSSLVFDRVPLQVGGRLRRVNTGIRTIELPIHIWGETHAQLTGRIRQLRRWMTTPDPLLPGYFEVTSSLGNAYEIACHYASGFDAIREDSSSGGANWRDVTISLEAMDAYWQDAADTVVPAFSVPSATGLWFPMSFPIFVGSSTVIDRATVTNEGDTDAFPVWTIYGPGSNPTMRNLTTGKVVSIVANVGSGDLVLIDTRPHVASISDQNNANLQGITTTDSELWPLVPGDNLIQVEMSGATSAASIALSYRTRYDAPADL